MDSDALEVSRFMREAVRRIQEKMSLAQRGDAFVDVAREVASKMRMKTGTGEEKAT